MLKERMKQGSGSHRENLLVAAVVAVSITGLWFYFTWRYGFDLADEGFYWYGAQRVLRGEVPVRDFWSYDIGRYYWAALLMHVMGRDDILSARVAATLFQALGSFLGVYIYILSLRQNGALKWILALLLACILTVLSFPYYKSYDHTTVILIVAAMVLMLEIAKPAAWLAAGLCIGFAAVMSRNHGVYGAVTAIVIITILAINAPSRRAVVGLTGYFLLGVVAGFLPNIVMMIFVEGFADAMIDSIVVLIHAGATNIPHSVPWPWLADLVEGNGMLIGAGRVFIGMGFLFLLVFPVLGVLALAHWRFDLNSDRRRIFAASLVVAIPYVHYAFSRADIQHLALGMVPVVIGLMVAAGALSILPQLAASVIVLALLVVTVAESRPYLSAKLLKKTFLQAEVDGQSLWMPPRLQKKFLFVTKMLASQAGNVPKFLAVPDMTSLYAVFRTRMPLWEIYSVLPRNAKFEVSEIKRLESFAPELILLSEHGLDDRFEFQYSQLHPLTYQWITSRYKIIETGDGFGEPDFMVYSAKSR